MNAILRYTSSTPQQSAISAMARIAAASNTAESANQNQTED